MARRKPLFEGTGLRSSSRSTSALLWGMTGVRGDAAHNEVLLLQLYLVDSQQCGEKANFPGRSFPAGRLRPGLSSGRSCRGDRLVVPRDVGHLGHYVAGTCAATMSAMTTSPRSRLRYQSEWRGGSVKWRPRSRHESSARGRADRATTVGEQAQGLSLAPAHPMLRLCSPALRVAFGEDRSHALGPSHRPRNPLRMPLVL